MADRPLSSPAALRLGFIALTDAAPLLVAREQGLFARHGLRVELRREVGWATIRDKIVYGELDGAHAPAPMLWAAQLGKGCAPTDVCTGVVLNLHGNAITLATALRAEGVRDAETLRKAALARRGENKLTFGIAFPYSMHHVLLRHWLRGARLDPDRDVRIAVVPPAQILRNLAAGTLAGYCVGEPWNSLAVQEGHGWCPAWSATLSPGHVEKVLMVRTKFAERRAAEHLALVAAIVEAAAWCDEPQNRDELATLLAHPACLDLPAKVIVPALQGRFDCGYGRVEDAPDFQIFSRGDANAPTAARATAVQQNLIATSILAQDLAGPALPGTLFREDIYRAALTTASVLRA